MAGWPDCKIFASGEQLIFSNGADVFSTVAQDISGKDYVGGDTFPNASCRESISVGKIQFGNIVEKGGFADCKVL